MGKFNLQLIRPQKKKEWRKSNVSKDTHCEFSQINETVDSKTQETQQDTKI